MTASLFTVALLTGVPTAAGVGIPYHHTYGLRFCEAGKFAHVRQGYHVRLAMRRPVVRPGGAAYARIENRGSVIVDFGVGYSVQRLDQGRWRPAPGGPRGGEILIAFRLEGGKHGWCSRYRVPRNAEPGRYRFVKYMETMTGTERRYVAFFRVIR